MSKTKLLEENKKLKSALKMLRIRALEELPLRKYDIAEKRLRMILGDLVKYTY